MLWSAVILIVPGILGAIFLNPTIGVIIAGLGMLLLLFNPVIWASFLRARERVQLAAAADSAKPRTIHWDRGRSGNRR